MLRCAKEEVGKRLRRLLQQPRTQVIQVNQGCGVFYAAFKPVCFPRPLFQPRQGHRNAVLAKIAADSDRARTIELQTVRGRGEPRFVMLSAGNLGHHGAPVFDEPRHFPPAKIIQPPFTRSPLGEVFDNVPCQESGKAGTHKKVGRQGALKSSAAG